MKKINFKLLFGSLVASVIIMLILHLISYLIFSIPKLLEAFNNSLGSNIEKYTFDIVRNLVVLGLLTIIIYLSIGE